MKKQKLGPSPSSAKNASTPTARRFPRSRPEDAEDLVSRAEAFIEAVEDVLGA
jgi:hypothetical protein